MSVTDDSSKPKRLLSLEEILAGLSELAESGEGAQRTQAYRMLLAERTGAAAGVPEPTSEADIEEMAIMMYRFWGPERCKRIWHLAFRGVRKELDSANVVGQEMLSAQQRKDIDRVFGLKTLYRLIPEIKRKGLPQGYPLSKGKEAQKYWCRKQATEILINRELEKIKAEADA